MHGVRHACPVPPGTRRHRRRRQHSNHTGAENAKGDAGTGPGGLPVGRM